MVHINWFSIASIKVDFKAAKLQIEVRIFQQQWHGVLCDISIDLILKPMEKNR